MFELNASPAQFHRRLLDGTPYHANLILPVSLLCQQWHAAASNPSIPKKIPSPLAAMTLLNKILRPSSRFHKRFVRRAQTYNPLFFINLHPPKLLQCLQKVHPLFPGHSINGDMLHRDDVVRAFHQLNQYSTIRRWFSSFSQK